MKGLLSIEEYLDTNRSLYYQGLEENEKDVTNYLEFILDAIDQTAEETKAEILNIIRERKMVSFDQIRRPFMGVNERTLRFDLKKLADAGLIKKLGATKGVFYVYT